jgi:hypothetical protein
MLLEFSSFSQAVEKHLSAALRCAPPFDGLTLRPAQGDKIVIMVSAACPELAEGNLARLASERF